MEMLLKLLKYLRINFFSYTRIIVFLIPSLIFSQKVFTTDYQSQSDIKVFVVDYESQSDLKVFKVDYQSQSKGNEGLVLCKISLSIRQEYLLCGLPISI